MSQGYLNSVATALPSGPGTVEALQLHVRQQPDDVTCGPTCLQAVYDFYGVTMEVEDVVASVRSLDHGGTLGVLLGLDALDRGFDATLFTYNLDIFDPSWFGSPKADLRLELRRQLGVRTEPRLLTAIEAYVDFVDRGGVVEHQELRPQLISDAVRSGCPPITGLSATYLYGCPREVFDGRRSTYDDVRGEPVGHFVVVSGVDSAKGQFRVSDPYRENPLHDSGTYWVSPDRLTGAILLGVTTYDGNVLFVRPRTP